MMMVEQFSFTQLTCPCERSKGITLEFSDGTIESFVLKSTTTKQTFKLSKPVATAFVKVHVVTVYSTTNNGAGELAFYGSAVPPSARRPPTPSCARKNKRPHTAAAACLSAELVPYDKRGQIMRLVI